MKNIYNKNKGFVEVALAVTVGALLLSGIFGLKAAQDAKLAESRYESVMMQTYNLGAFRPSNYVGKLLTRLNEGGSETTFNTTPGTAKDGSTLTTAKIGDFVVFTINPGAANEEKISASAVSVSGTTATWTIINRGLSFTENTAVTANKKQHAIGETVIISNDDHYLNVQYAAKDLDETITGSWTFSQFPVTPATVYATETVAGASELATGIEVASSTSLGGSGQRLTIPASLATSTYNSATAPLRVIVTQNDGKIDGNFISTSSLFVNSALTGSTTANNLTIVNPSQVYDQSGNQLLWALVASTTASSTANNIVVSNIPDRAVLKVFIDVKGLTGKTGYGIRFNQDTGGNYSSTSTVNATYYQLNHPANDSNNMAFYELTINNAATTTHPLIQSGLIYPNASTPNPFDVIGGGVWKSSTNQFINHITLFSGGAFYAGTRVWVYATPF